MIERSYTTDHQNGVIAAVFASQRPQESERDRLISEIHRNFQRCGSFLCSSNELYTLGEVSSRQTIAKGEFGRVVKAVHRLTGLPVAVKVISRELLKTEKWRARLRREVDNLRKVRHPHVIRLLDCYSTPRSLMLVTEFLGGGTLLSLLRTRGRLDETHAKSLFRQVLCGVVAIHDAGIVHRNLKLENVLVDEEAKVAKICDFGYSLRLKKGQMILDKCGAPAYLAPETLISKGYEGFSVDSWSLGVLLYTLVCGSVPFRAHSLADLQKAILRGSYNLPLWLSADCAGVIRGLLQIIPQNRIPLPDLLRSGWLDVSGLSDKAQVSVNIDEFVLRLVESFGFPQEFTIASLQGRQLNHAVASYYLLWQSMHIAT